MICLCQNLSCLSGNGTLFNHCIFITSVDFALHQSFYVRPTFEVTLYNDIHDDSDFGDVFIFCGKQIG